MKYPEYSEIKNTVLKIIEDRIRKARGTAVMIKPLRICRHAGWKCTPTLLTIINHILKELEAKGLIKLWSTNRGVYRYIITSESPLWIKVKTEAKLKN